MTFKLTKQILFISAFLLSFFVAAPTLAADPKPNIQHSAVAVKYAGQSIPDPIEIEAGASKTVIMKFKNVGTETLNSLSQHLNGYKHVSAYTMEPRYRKSDFAGTNWISKSQTASITKDTKPGEIAELAIVLKAPEELGTYTEEFYLAAENYTWVKGGYFFLKVKVVEKKETQTTETPPQPSPTRGGSGDSAPTEEDVAKPQARKFIQSKKSVEAKGGERIDFVLAFQNSGDVPWKEYKLISNQPTALAAANTKLSFADEVWLDSKTVVAKNSEVIPGKFFREKVYFRAPAKKGTYTARFTLHVDGIDMEDALVEIPVTVTADAPSHYQTPKSDSNNSDVQASYRLASESKIRVGLWRPETFVQFKSTEDPYEVFAGSVKVGELPVGKLGVLKIKNGKYSFKGGALNFETDDYIRLEPKNNPYAVFEILNYKRLVTWKGPANFNKYRGAMEYRRGEIKDDVWVVNELFLEDYVEGIGENSNNSPAEYLKAQSVAQRSYAYATIQSDKYGIFDVVATTGDQLYLGYENEKIMGNFVKAVKATRGQMVTYDNNIVITPYFARTNCRTLAWTEKWGGKTKPWLVSVPTNYDCARGLRLFGHGVGMSQIDASIRAKKEGLGWRDLVKYYYTGVEIEKVYE